MPKKAKRADGRYQVSLDIGRDENGKRIRKYFYGETQKEANQKKKEYAEGLAVSADAKSMTTAVWADIWVERYSSGGFRNQENNKSIINVFKDFLGLKAKRPIGELLPADIQGFARQMSGRSKSHINKVKRVLGNLFQAAVDNGYIAKSPCVNIVWTSVKNNVRDAADPLVVDLVTKYWRIHPAGKWAMLVLYAGLRPSEAFALRAENIVDGKIKVRDGSHFEHGQLVITEGKTKTPAGQRDIPILPPLRPVVEAFPKEGLVCRTTKGNPVSQSAYKRNWVAFFHLLELIYNDKLPNAAMWQFESKKKDWKPLPKTDIYSFRHSFCSFLYDSGVDTLYAQELMGHDDLEMTLKIYTHLSEKKKKRSYDALFEHFGEKMDVKMDVKNPE